MKADRTVSDGQTPADCSHTDRDVEARAMVETVFRIERVRLIAGLARMMRDVDLAEELAQDALVAALSAWPRDGLPENAGAWLMATAKRRAIDHARRRKMLKRKHAEIERDFDESGSAGIGAVEASLDDDIGDERLALIFTACDPVLSPEARAALTLRLIGGLTTAEIARAFLASEAAIAQRITRAKKTIAAAGLAFAVPRGAERAKRLASVLEVIYLIFNEGYAATAGDNLTRPVLCAEAMRLGRMVSGLAPDETEPLGLLALMELQASRLKARAGPDGALVPITEQNRALWDRLLIQRGLAALERAEARGGGDGPYVLQAALAACHARARRAEETEWSKIAGLYLRLGAVMPSPVVALNHAVAVSMAEGPAAGLALLAPIEKSGVLDGYAPLAAARGDFLFRAGRRQEAASCFLAAAALSSNMPERAFLLGRAEACRHPTVNDTCDQRQ